MSIASSDSHACPRFIALSFDEYVEADSDLDELIRILAGLVDPNNSEEICIWEDYRIAAIVKADGRVIRFDSAESPQS